MFNIDDTGYIKRLIDQIESDEFVIPLYVKIYNDTYSILELDKIDLIMTYDPYVIKVGFGTRACPLIKNSFPMKHVHAYEFDIVKTFIEFDDHLNTDIRYFVFESRSVNGDSVLHDNINHYFSIISDYIEKRCDVLRREYLNTHLKEYMT